MPRKTRKLSNTGIYHVMLRGLDRCQIFHDEQDLRKFLKILHLVTHPLDADGKPMPPYCDIYAYCLMTNHVHLLIGEHSEDISSVMKRIGISYVSYFNKRYSRLGSLFHDRFRSEPVEDEGYFIKLIRYIHQNPVEAEIVDSANQYRWSSLHEYSGSFSIDYDICTKSLPFVSIDWLDLQKLVIKVSSDEHLRPQNAMRRLTDDEARSIINTLSGNAEVKMMDKSKRNAVIIAAVEKGISMRQLSRLIRLEYKSIYLILKNNKKK